VKLLVDTRDAEHLAAAADLSPRRQTYDKFLQLIPKLHPGSAYASVDIWEEKPMAVLEVFAHLTVRPGQLDGFKKQAAECIRITKEKDTKTLRYDWFLSSDGTECEVHEAYASEDGMIEHNAHVMDARAVLFERYAYDHRMSVYGEISQPLRDLFDKHAGGVSSYSFLQGLETTAAA